MEMRKCVVCGKPILEGSKKRQVCSDACADIRDKERDRAWRKNNPEKYQAQLDRFNEKNRQETAAARNPKAVRYVPPTFQERWKKADNLTKETMIAIYWRDHRDNDFSYGKYAAMKNSWPEMHREIRRYVLLCNGIDEDNEVITSYNELCAICGKPACDTHHLVFGRGIRPLADADGLVIPICRSCHSKIHESAEFGTMSKMLGQLQWENEHPDKGREGFRLRYGKSWL